jgi:RHS repeat-associated protein
VGLTVFVFGAPQPTTGRIPGSDLAHSLGWRVGRVAPEWAGAALFDASLRCELAIGIAAHTLPDAFRLGVVAVTPESDARTQWKPALLLRDGRSVWELLRRAPRFLALEEGARTHLPAWGFTVRRESRGIRFTSLDGVRFVVDAARLFAARAHGPLGEDLDLRFAADGALISIESRGSSIVCRSEGDAAELTGIEELAAEKRTSLATLLRSERGLVRNIDVHDARTIALEYDEAGRLVDVATMDADRLHVVRAPEGDGAIAGFRERSLGSWQLAKVGERACAAASFDGGIRVLHWDARGHWVREEAPRGARTELERGPNGAITQLVRHGRRLSYFYDIDGFVVLAEVEQGPQCHYEYDLEGRLALARVSGRGWTRRVYDTEGRLALLSDPNGTRELSWAPDGSSCSVARLGAKATVAFAQGRARDVENDRGRSSLARKGDTAWLMGPLADLYIRTSAYGVVRWGAADQFDANLERDASRRVIGWSSGREHVRAERDADGALTAIRPGCEIERRDRRWARIHIGGLVEERERDHLGRSVSLRRNDACVRSRTFTSETSSTIFGAGSSPLVVVLDNDGLASIEELTRADPHARVDAAPRADRIRFERDESGRVCGAVRGANALRLGRANGRIVTEIGTTSSVSCARGETGGRASMRAPDFALATDRDAEGRIARLVVETHEKVPALFEYDGAGREVRREVGPVSMRFERDALGRVVRRSVTHGTRAVSTTLYRWQGKRLTAAEGESGTRHFEYDGAGALTAFGNDEHHIRAEGEVAFGHQLAGVRYDPVGLPLEAAGVRYEASRIGFLCAAKTARARTEYAYDALGQLLCVRGPALEADFERDAFGRMVGRTVRRYAAPARATGDRRPSPDAFRSPRPERTLVGETRTQIVWCGPRPVERTTDAGRSYFHAWADGLLVLQIVDSEPFVVVPDPFGDAEALLDRSGELVWSRDPATLVFGSVDEGAADYGMPSLPDHFYDAELGLWHSLFRSYDPTTARYLSPNPIGLAAGPHLYAASADPIRNRMRFGIGLPLEPFWAELASGSFDEEWVRSVLRELTCDVDERGTRAWRTLDDSPCIDPERLLLEQAGLRDPGDA